MKKSRFILAETSTMRKTGRIRVKPGISWRFVVLGIHSNHHFYRFYLS